MVTYYNTAMRMNTELILLKYYVFFQPEKKPKPHRICTAKNWDFKITRWIVFTLMTIPSMLDIGQQVFLMLMMRTSRNKFCNHDVRG